jgi:hypothetical protein
MHHAPLAIKGGVSAASMKEIRKDGPLARSQRPEGFTDKQWAVCVVSDEMTRNVQVAGVSTLRTVIGAVITIGIISNYRKNERRNK